jgi:hypothetical protein
VQPEFRFEDVGGMRRIAEYGAAARALAAIHDNGTRQMRSPAFLTAEAASWCGGDGPWGIKFDISNSEIDH